MNQKNIFNAIAYTLAISVFAIILKYYFIKDYISPILSAYLNPIGCFQQAASSAGVLYSIVCITIVLNILVSWYFFDHKSSRYLLGLVKDGKANIFFLNFRYYLALVSGCLLVSMSAIALAALMGIDLEFHSLLEPNIGIVLTLIGIHLIFSALTPKSNPWLPLLQAFMLVLVNFIFLVFCLQGYLFQMLTLVSLNLLASILAMFVSSLIGSYLQSFFVKAFLVLANKDDRKESMKAMPVSIYLWRFYSFISFSQLVAWFILYHSNFQAGSDLLAGKGLTSLIVGAVWLIIAYVFLKSCANYCTLKSAKAIICPLPLDFYLIFLKLVQPLASIYHLTWSTVHQNSFLGLGLTLANPTKALTFDDVDYDHFVFYIASPSESSWTFFNTTVPNVLSSFYSAWKDRNLEMQVEADESRLAGYYRNLKTLEKSATNERDLQLLNTYFEKTYGSSDNKYKPLDQRIEDIQTTNRVLSEFANTSDLCTGPVSPRSGIVKTQLLKDCFEKAAAFVDVTE